VCGVSLKPLGWSRATGGTWPSSSLPPLFLPCLFYARAHMRPEQGATRCTDTRRLMYSKGFLSVRDNLIPCDYILISKYFRFFKFFTTIL